MIDLPDFLVKDRISKIAAGVEVPINYNKPLPDTYMVAELSECTMLYFQSEPYENPDDFGNRIGQVFKAIESYNLERYSYKSANDIAPTLNLGAEPEIGAKVAVPVVKIDE